MEPSSIADWHHEEMPKTVAPWHTAQMGDLCDHAHLFVNGGKFYELDGKKFCDMPIMTFEEDSTGFYKRIE